MKTKKLTGYFNVREFSTNRLKDDSEIIRFVTTYKSETDVAEELKSRVRQFTNKYNEPRFAIEFKIPSSCRWFDKYGKATTRPTNAELENVMFEVVIDYRDVVPTEAFNKEKKKYNPDGFYCNAIMYNSAAVNPFEGEFLAEPTSEPQTDAQTEAERNTEVKEAADNLPF